MAGTQGFRGGQMAEEEREVQTVERIEVRRGHKRP
jgi:hypothetical protein